MIACDALSTAATASRTAFRPTGHSGALSRITPGQVGDRGRCGLIRIGGSTGTPLIIRAGRHGATANARAVGCSACRLVAATGHSDGGKDCGGI